LRMSINEQRIKELERSEAKLHALEAGGVDIWDFYDESLTDWRAENEHEEKICSLVSDLKEAFGECAYEPSERGAGIAFAGNVASSVLGVLKQHGVIFKGDK
jgi:hypothetical protein